MRPVFYVALAHTDNFAHFNTPIESKSFRVSNINLFPSSLKENLLFSMSYNPTIHYDTMHSNLDPIGSTEALTNHATHPQRIFADCGAFQFCNSDTPTLSDGTILTHEVAWEYYYNIHVQSSHEWVEILLCSPDHIILPNMTDEEVERRFDFIRVNAGPFLDLSSTEPRVTAVGVIHGRTNDERIGQYEMFKQLGYKYLAIGGMVPYSTKKSHALNIIAGIENIHEPKISPDSILGRCRKDGIKLHIFGLNSPEWCRWWCRLDIDSFDGSKLSTEGAANGWYWIQKDGSGAGRNVPSQPTTVSEIYHRIAVKKMGAESWNWSKTGEVMTPEVPVTEHGIDTSCDCPACEYLKSSRCTSDRCWLWQRNSECRHVSDPRMMGSTEHNMGRVAHNAYVYSWIIGEIDRLNLLASKSNLQGDDAWLQNWATIGVRQ